MLEEGENLGLVVELHQQRLDPLVGPAQAAEQLVGVSGPRSLAHDLGAAPGLDEDGVAFLGEAPEQRGDRHVERAGEALEGGEAGEVCAFSILESIPLEMPGPLRQLAHVEADLQAARPHVVGDDLAQMALGLGRAGVIDGHGLLAEAPAFALVPGRRGAVRGVVADLAAAVGGVATCAGPRVFLAAAVRRVATIGSL